MEWACFAFSLCFIQDEAKSLKETKGGKKESSTGTVENKDKKSTKAKKSKISGAKTAAAHGKAAAWVWSALGLSGSLKLLSTFKLILQNLLAPVLMHVPQMEGTW